MMESRVPFWPNHVRNAVVDGIVARDVPVAQTVQPPHAARLAAVWARIQEYGQLGPDWAGPGTVAPNPATIGYARTLLASLPSKVAVPLVAASGDGEVVLTWLVNGDRIEAAIDEDGFLSWATRVAGTVLPGGSVNLVDGSPDAFNEVLAHHFA